MRVNGLVKILAGTAVAATLGMSSAANAVSYGIIPGSGYSDAPSGTLGVGDTGTDAFGNSWDWTTTSGPMGSASPGAGFDAWGTPGLGDFTATYKGIKPADAFFVSFVVDHTGATFNETPSPFTGGYNEFTRFNVCTSTCVAWTPVYLDNQNEVDFYAPPGDSLTFGEQYFVNITFNQKTLSGTNIGFSAAFAAPVPEAPAWAMMILGVGLAGAALRRNRSVRRAPAVA